MSLLGLILGVLILCGFAARLGRTEEVSSQPSGLNTVVSNYTIPGEFITIDVPQSREDTFGRRSTCYNYARHIEEPYSPHYWPRKKFTLEPPWDKVKRSYWIWDGPITRADFEEILALNCSAKFHEIVHYKIINRRLYTPSKCQACTKHGFACTARRIVSEEVLKVLLYLWPMPDMEFFLTFGDGCNGEPKPTINPVICRKPNRSGFSMPSAGVWARSMGPTQMSAFHWCLRRRYPANQRKPQVVWRGGSTNPRPITMQNYLEAPRVLLHLLGLNHSDIMDTRITRLVPAMDRELKEMLTPSLAPPMADEDYNAYCAVVDVDGIGWTDRFGHTLIHYPTTVLKQATNRTAYFEQYYPPGVSFVQFAPDFSDFVEKARAVVEDCKQNGAASWGQRLADTMTRTTTAYMDHVGIAEATAYALLAYRNLTTWKVDMSLEGWTEVNMTCCKFTMLPPKFAEAVSRRLDGLPPQGPG